MAMFRSRRCAPRSRKLPSAVGAGFARLEDRTVPSGVMQPYFEIEQPVGPVKGGQMTPHGSLLPPASAKTPAQIRGAYNLNNIVFGGITGDGTGQTIAIIDAQDNPSFVSSNSASFNTSALHLFDQQFGLADPPIFIKSGQSGSLTSYPAADPGGWGTEIALDVEWAHVMAPGACILLVEANSAQTTNLFAGVNFAKAVTGSTFAAFPNLPPVTAISMSFGASEFSGETSFDSTFTTPAGHAGVTFFASTGDNGAPAGYPSYSPNVVAVGGTSLITSGNTWLNESAWSGSGGGVSTQENKPTYQSLVSQSTTRRTTPDVSLDADPNTGVAVYDPNAPTGTPNGFWYQVGGTSLSSPMFAGLMAVANQGRASLGEATLDGRTGTLPKIYAEMSAAGLAVTDFHDPVSGNNGFAAGVGYDLVTGVGSPFADRVVANLMDDAPPTAAASTTNITSPGAQPYSFTVTYSDNHNVKFRTLDGSDIVVTGPNGFSTPATFVSVDTNSDGSPRTATYQFTPPGSAWDAGDNGTYNVVLQANQVSDTAGNFAASATVGTFSVAIATAPTVASTVVNDGSAQRSSVTSVTITFSTQVAFAGVPESAFTLTRSDSTTVGFTATVTVNSSGQTVVVLSNFTGSATSFGSLADGRYTLSTVGGQISANGTELDGDNNGSPGGNYTFGDAQGLYRFFGDINGDRRVDIADFGLFSTSYNLQMGQGGYLAAFDYNGDNRIDIADFGQFSLRYLANLP